MFENYSHFDNSIIYIVENIPGPAEETEDYVSLLEDFNSQITSFCECQDLCHTLCSCIAKSGVRNYIQQDNCVRINPAKLHSKIMYPVFECNILCKCSNICGNRVVQHGAIDCLIINDCQQEDKGLGLFATKTIPAGTFLCEYAGELITKSQALQKQQKNRTAGNMNYIFCLNEHSNGNVKQTVVDPSKFGNIGRYINHSCEPNTQIVPVRVDSPIPKLAIFACRDIICSSEITFDYGPYSLDTGLVNVAEKKKCLCGSKKCRGWMPLIDFDV